MTGERVPTVDGIARHPTLQWLTVASDQSGKTLALIEPFVVRRQDPHRSRGRQVVQSKLGSTDAEAKRAESGAPARQKSSGASLWKDDCR